METTSNEKNITFGKRPSQMSESMRTLLTYSRFLVCTTSTSATSWSTTSRRSSTTSSSHSSRSPRTPTRILRFTDSCSKCPCRANKMDLIMPNSLETPRFYFPSRSRSYETFQLRITLDFRYKNSA